MAWEWLRTFLPFGRERNETNAGESGGATPAIPEATATPEPAISEDSGIREAREPPELSDGFSGDSTGGEEDLEPTFVMCVRVDQMIGEPVEGSSRELCSSCGAEVWAAPSSRSVVAEKALAIFCIQCAAPGNAAEDEERAAAIARLKREAEQAYDEMYDLHDDREIRWRAEFAVEGLRSAARLEREAGLVEDAEATEARAQHIRRVYRHQFMQPPDLMA
jgi:hypothetical protein